MVERNPGLDGTMRGTVPTKAGTVCRIGRGHSMYSTVRHVFEATFSLFQSTLPQAKYSIPAEKSVGVHHTTHVDVRRYINIQRGRSLADCNGFACRLGESVGSSANL